MPYIGGKSQDGVYQRIISQISPQKVYIELFLGDGAIMRLKKSARVNIGVEIDPDVVANWLTNPIENVQVIHGDALAFLDSYSFKGEEFIYADPPYLPETLANGKQRYRYPFPKEKHVELIKKLKKIPLTTKIAISGYWSQLYEKLLADWRYISYPTTTRGHTSVTEYLWMNYSEPTELHDYRYIGEDFTDRQRIKRKQERWKNRFTKLPILERRAVLAVIDELREQGKL